MMDHISRVGVFLEVAKYESFAGAARALGLTAGPAISKQVQSLEDQLGVKLLNRTTRHVSLNEEGAMYIETARKAHGKIGFIPTWDGLRLSRLPCQASNFQFH